MPIYWMVSEKLGRDRPRGLEAPSPLASCPMGDMREKGTRETRPLLLELAPGGWVMQKPPPPSPLLHPAATFSGLPYAHQLGSPSSFCGAAVYRPHVVA